MSIFFDFEVGPTGRRFRKAVDQDKKDIELFWNQDASQGLFYDVNIGSLIELATLAICMIDEKKDVTGFMALCDHPNVPGVDPAHWEMWVTNMFQRYYQSRNTLFVHFMCCVDSVAKFFFEEAIVSIFLNDMYLSQIALIVPPCISVDDVTKYQMSKKRNVFKLYARGDDQGETYHCMQVALRQDFCPKLKVRRAVEEDNDDIVEIMDSKCPLLKNLYGNYYISEILGRHPESNRKVLVAQAQDRAVGVMCLNSDVNYTNIQAMYELDPYYGLVKATPLEKEQYKRDNTLLKTFGDPIMLGKWSPFNTVEKLEVNPLDDDEPSKEKLTGPRRSKRLSKVNFRKKTEFPQTSDDYSEKILYDPSPMTSQEVDSVTCLLEEDPFEYEIVNIDSSLLYLPEVSAQDLSSKSTQPSERMSTFRNRRRKSCQKMVEPPPKYSGTPNAYVIEIYGLREDIDERRGFDFLQASFECMKTYDYCIIRVLTTEKHFSLLQHFTFVPTRSNVCCKYALYVAHRSSILGKLRVRKAEYVDIPQIAIMLQNLDAKETLWAIEHSIVETKQHQAYVFVSGLSLVGLAILEPPEQIDHLRAKFTVDAYHSHQHHASGHAMNSGFSTLKNVLVYPAFETHYRFFAREVLRLNGSSCMIWLTHYRNKLIAHKANALASAMIPILPRKSTLAYSLLSEPRKHKNLSKNIMPFSMWFISKKFTSVPKVNVDTRLVVVGASRTALAFLNNLLFRDSCSYLTFTSVTVVSPHGLPYARHANVAAEMMFPKFRTNSDRYLKSTPYTYYVNVVHGTLVEIHKQEKYIRLENGSKFFYDMLFLLFGKQYQHPDYMKALFEKEREYKTIPTYVRLDQQRHMETEPQVAYYDTPDNVFIINTIAAAAKALAFVRTWFNQGNDNFKVLVYGETLEAYCCLSALLEINVPAENIIFVEPFPSEDESRARVPIFCNTNVDKTVREVLDTLHVKVYRSYYFRSWECDLENMVTHVEFLSYFEAIRLECNAFFYYGKRGINPQAFVAINKCGLPYDGGILIDHEFRTKDPAIYAAGPATRYHRRYFAESKRQKYYDSYDVGSKLGTQIRNQLDPLFIKKESSHGKHSKSGIISKSVSFEMTTDSIDNYEKNIGSSHRSSKDSLPKDNGCRLPEFKRPIVWHCTLPGNLQYLEVRAPGKKVPHQYVQSLHYNGVFIETFKRGYFKLHFTSEYIVDGITCLTPEENCLENFRNIYGMSAVTLNNVHLRYSAKGLDDLYEYFCLPWAIYLYHEHLEELLAMVKELVPKEQGKGMTLEEALRCVAENLECSPGEKHNTKTEKMCYKFEKSAHFAAVTDYVIEWLAENDILLPGYLEPRQVAEYSHDLGRHPAFRKRKLSVAQILSNL